jgi:hypothetical protein
MCASLRAVPGGTASQPYPTGQPVIRTSLVGGGTGGTHGGVDLWADGTVHFYGPHCKSWRGRVQKLDPDKMRGLLASFERANFEHLPWPAHGPCPDAMYRIVALRGSAGWRSFRRQIHSPDQGKIR